MKTITVKSESSVSIYSSGTNFQFNSETGEQQRIEQSEEEDLQNCYRSLIDDIKNKEFDKNIIRLLPDRIGNMEEWDNIKIEVSFSDKNRRCEMNISNPDNLKWTEITDLKLPEE
jgi:hypothetical protein